MPIELKTFVVGPLQNNCYLLLDPENNIAAMIDPPLAVETIFPQLKQAGITITHILITHAHFDHIGGVQPVLETYPVKPQIYMHQDELALWQQKGSAANFGIDFPLPEKPDQLFSGEPTLQLGAIALQTRFTPGHTSGHCTFYLPEMQSAFCGDVIFHHSIGRTDLPGGNFATLEKSIREKIYTLPPDTTLYPGHGEFTTVVEEQRNNPFIN